MLPPSFLVGSARAGGEIGAARSTGRLDITVFGCDVDEAVLFREKAPALGITPVITGAAVSETTIELATGNRCISVGHKTDITNSHLLALSHAGVQYISTRSIGYNHIDVASAERLGIRVENVAYSPASVADYTLMLMLMALRHAASVLRRVAAHDYRLPEVRGRELGDLTVGVIGTGRIGAAVIDRLRGFGCRILAHDDRHTTSVDYVPLDELLRESDVVTLHAPLTADTRHLLDGPRLDQLKPGAVVVNTARGALIDTDALIRALETGRMGGAALDVVEDEEGVFYADHRDQPVASERLRRLQRLPNVVVSPHTAYYTERALSDIVENSLQNCLRFEGRNHG
jgi:D-specific alpha-keto acid dehydrogenase